MNLIDATENSLLERISLFLIFFIPSVALILYFIVKSKELSDFLEALSDQRLSYRAKLETLSEVWRKGRRPAG
jgi:hypothetical protein